MKLRDMMLPPGWYPRQKDKIDEFLSPFTKNKGAMDSSGAIIVPHAGWYYSGKLAAEALASLDPDAQTIAVIGGHLPGGMPILAAFEEGVKTPLGAMEIDSELRKKLEKQLSFMPDRYQDNTIEVLLPMVHYFFSNAKILWLRFPAELSSFEAGKALYNAAMDLGRRIAIIASTDLTHYGTNYGFYPHGKGRAALEWVKKVNDTAFINAVLDRDPKMVLKRANEDQSSCSAGAVLGALGFTDQRIEIADKNEVTSPKLLKYQTSADISNDSTLNHSIDDYDVPDSFVGYAAISLG